MIRYWIDHVRKKKFPRKEEVPATSFHRRLHSNKLVIKDGILLRRTKLDDENRDQIVLTAFFVSTVLKYLDNQMGQEGRDRTSSLVKDRFF